MYLPRAYDFFILHVVYIYAHSTHVYTLIDTFSITYTHFILYVMTIENAEKAPYNDNRDAEQPPDYN